MRELPIELIREKNKIATTYPWLIMLEVTLTSGEILRYVNNNEDIVFQTNTYYAFPFNLEPTKYTSKGEIPSVSLTISNVDKVIQQKLELVNGGVGSTVKLTIVNYNNLSSDYSELEMIFNVIGTSTDESFVTFTLGAYNPLRKRFPLYRFIADHCNWKYKSEECGYSNNIVNGGFDTSIYYNVGDFDPWHLGFDGGTTTASLVSDGIIGNAMQLAPITPSQVACVTQKIRVNSFSNYLFGFYAKGSKTNSTYGVTIGEDFYTNGGLVLTPGTTTVRAWGDANFLEFNTNNTMYVAPAVINSVYTISQVVSFDTIRLTSNYTGSTITNNSPYAIFSKEKLFLSGPITTTWSSLITSTFASTTITTLNLTMWAGGPAGYTTTYDEFNILKIGTDECKRTYDDCSAHNNILRYGGFKGLGSGGIRLV